MEPTAVSRRSFLGALGAGASLAAFSLPGPGQGPERPDCHGLYRGGRSGTLPLERTDEAERTSESPPFAMSTSTHLDRAIGVVEKAKGYRPQGLGDFRKLLEIQEIDAVTVVTPDHWHAIPTVTAFEAGKTCLSKNP